jgi:hypothetical protein
MQTKFFKQRFSDQVFQKKKFIQSFLNKEQSDEESEEMMK